MLKARVGIVAAGCLVAAGLVLSIGSTAVGQPNETDFKKIAELVRKGDMAGAKKLAAAYAKKNSDVDELMTVFKDPKKKGLGVKDSEVGIEKTLTKIGRDAPTAANMAKMAEGFTDMGYNIAAAGLITEALAPEKDAGKKTRKAWLEWSTGLVDSGIAIAEASKGKSAADVKTHAAKVNTNCNSCHTLFK